MYKKGELIKVKLYEDDPWVDGIFHNYGGNNDQYVFCVKKHYNGQFARGELYALEVWPFHEPISLGDEHPLLVEALKNKVPIKCRVNPEQNQMFQEICFENDVFWNGQTRGHLEDLNKKYLFVGFKENQYGITWYHHDGYFSKHDSKEYDFTNKCFVEKKEEPQYRHYENTTEVLADDTGKLRVKDRTLNSYTKCYSVFTCLGDLMIRVDDKEYEPEEAFKKFEWLNQDGSIKPFGVKL